MFSIVSKIHMIFFFKETQTHAWKKKEKIQASRSMEILITEKVQLNKKRHAKKRDK